MGWCKINRTWFLMSLPAWNIRSEIKTCATSRAVVTRSSAFVDRRERCSVCVEKNKSVRSGWHDLQKYPWYRAHGHQYSMPRFAASIMRNSAFVPLSRHRMQRSGASLCWTRSPRRLWESTVIEYAVLPRAPSLWSLLARTWRQKRMPCTCPCSALLSVASI